MKSCVTLCLVPSLTEGPWIYRGDLDRSIAKAKSVGFQAIELFTASADAIDAATLSRSLAEHDIRLAAVGTGAGRVLYGLSLTSPDAAIRKEAVRYIADMLAFGAEFGAHTIVGSMQGCFQAAQERQRTLSWLVEGLEELSTEAARHKVYLILEPLNRYETNLINTLGQGMSLIENNHLDHVGLLADFFHMNIEEISLSQALVEGKKHIKHIHLADSNRRPMGMGHTRMNDISLVLRNMGYEGYLSAEALPYPDPDRAAAQTIRAFAQLSSTCDEPG
jgi:sugar phosphate isomerase/epimerase